MVAVALVVASTGGARAEDADELVARGQELGKQGEWTQAVAAFKRADTMVQRTQHACLIALAYTRREMWPQAELYFARCHERAKTGEPVPDWAAEAEQQLADKLAGAAVPAVDIAVEPAGLAATIAISGFDPEDTLKPGTVHLPPGSYTIRASAPDYLPMARDIKVVAGQPQRIAFALVPSRVPNPARESRLPWIVAGAGGALVAAGVLTDVWKVQPLRDQMAKSQFEWRAHEGELDTWRYTTVGLWAAGAIAIGVGAYLEVRRERLPLTISASADAHGATFAIGWTR